jgi:hypothetical protein
MHAGRDFEGGGQLHRASGLEAEPHAFSQQRLPKHVPPHAGVQSRTQSTQPMPCPATHVSTNINIVDLRRSARTQKCAHDCDAVHAVATAMLRQLSQAGSMHLETIVVCRHKHGQHRRQARREQTLRPPQLRLMPRSPQMAQQRRHQMRLTGHVPVQLAARQEARTVVNQAHLHGNRHRNVQSQLQRLSSVRWS